MGKPERISRSRFAFFKARSIIRVFPKDRADAPMNV
jgi:hypothetical protein